MEVNNEYEEQMSYDNYNRSIYMTYSSCDALYRKYYNFRIRGGYSYIVRHINNYKKNRSYCQCQGKECKKCVKLPKNYWYSGITKENVGWMEWIDSKIGGNLKNFMLIVS